MKKVAIITALLFVSALSFGQLKSMWVAAPLKADGNSAEWPHPFGFYNSETKIMFAIANDDKNLYVCLETTDETSQAKIMKAGLKVNIATKGKNKHNATVEFPLPLDEEHGMPATKPNDIRPEPMKVHSYFLLNRQQKKVEGFDTKKGLMPAKDSLGISTFINWEGPKMVYEIKIPLTELYGPTFTEADLANELSLFVDLRAVERPGFSPGGAAGSPSNSGMGGSVTQPGGGMGGVNGAGGMGTPGYPNSYGNNGNNGYQGNTSTGVGRPAGYPPIDDDSATPQVNNSAIYLRTNFKEKFNLAKKP